MRYYKIKETLILALPDGDEYDGDESCEVSADEKFYIISQGDSIEYKTLKEESEDKTEAHGISILEDPLSLSLQFFYPDNEGEWPNLIVAGADKYKNESEFLEAARDALGDTGMLSHEVVNSFKGHEDDLLSGDVYLGHINYFYDSTIGRGHWELSDEDSGLIEAYILELN